MIKASRIKNITNEPHQKHQILYKGDIINLELKYLAVVEQWSMSVNSKSGELNGVKIAGTADLLYGSFLPYTFLCTTTEGVDPFSINDFASGRCKLFFIDRADIP